MSKKAPPEVLSPSDLAYMSTLNERDRRRFLATKAVDLKAQGLSYRKVSKIMGTSTHTLQKGRRELLSGGGPGDGRIRRTGAGRKSVLPQHPEWTQAVVQIIEPHTAGLPQDENVVWVSLSVTQIMSELSAIGLPIISIDTKKKEMLGNFKREGKAWSNGGLKSLDHDFATFSDGQIVPHGIYDVVKNVGYMTLGIRLLVVHYPPYCSKFNPIEHRLFSQITRSWSGAPLMPLQNAADRAAMTSTKKGLIVLVHINSKSYDIQRPIEESFQKRLARQVVFASEPGKWNYLVKPAN